MTDMSESSQTSWQPHLGLTLYGRKPALEALSDHSLAVHCVHLASSNRPGGIIAEITRLAERRGITIRHHDKQALSRISKNARQDQGVALDVLCPRFRRVEDLATSNVTQARVLALDGITNPQNVGMIVRSAVAAGIDGLLYPKRSVAALGPLVIKASAGTVFKAPILQCATLSALASKERRESRWGLWHYRTDYPDLNDQEWLKHIVLTQGEAPEDVKIAHREIIKL